MTRYELVQYGHVIQWKLSDKTLEELQHERRINELAHHLVPAQWRVAADQRSLVEMMERRLTEIIEENGFQEMADGFQQAIDMVKEHLKGTADE